MHDTHASFADPVSAAVVDELLDERDEFLLGVRLSEALIAVRADLPRADAQATGLLGLASALLVATLAVLGTGRLHGAAAGCGWATAGLLGAAVLTLTLVLRPRLGGQFGFTVWARLDPQQLVDTLLQTAPPDSPTDHLEQARKLRWLSRTLHRKFRRVQAAQALLLLALAAGAAAAFIQAR